MIILLKLAIVVLATNSISDRSFSVMRCIESYLHSTMSQERINNLIVLYIHKEYTESIKLCNIGNDYVSKSECRTQVLGKF